jgi:hypothetical protein
MSDLPPKIDFEVPAFGEVDAVVTAGASTIVQTTGDACGRGDVVARVTTAGAAAYIQKNLSYSVPAGGDCYVGFWYNVRSDPSGVANPFSLHRAAGWDSLFYYYAGGAGKIYAGNDGGGHESNQYANVFATGRWYWTVIRTHRASSDVAADGYVSLYVDGVLIGSTATVDNYDIMASLSHFTIGAQYYYDAGYNADFDEIKVAAFYPEPFVPTPTDEYPQARRTVVLFRQGDSDSRQFADYCVSELNIPRSNLCPLPNASANETLADYATFQAEVETDLAAWLALNPTVAANCSCFLLGHGVPGYFVHSWLKYSATSRLMNYGTAFTPATANPLYNPATVARLTKTALGGKYLCTRIDADTLQHAKDILDRGLQIADCGFLPATDKLYSDETDYRASLACQHLRIITAAFAEFAADAFVFGDTGTPSFGSAGSRAAFCDDSIDSADSLRSGSTACRSAITNSYAAALGCTAYAVAFDAESFFEMLRIGGTLAEALAVASPYLDSAIVGAGSPLMTVGFQLGGYNVYRGLGGIEGIDWEKPVACLRSGQDSITFGQDLSPNRRYVYAIRAVSAAGVEERNTHVITYVQTDDQGSLLSAPIARPTDLTADVQQSSLLIGFSYYAPVGFAEADGFDVLSDNGTGQLDLDNPVATVESSGEDRFDFEVAIARPETSLLLAVRARHGQRTGPISEILFVPLSAAPAPVQIL